MKLLNVMKAHSAWLFDLQDLNPRGKSIFPDLIDWLKEEYHFSKFPKSVSDLDPTTKALVFTGGEFMVEEEIFKSVDLTIYNDGLVANTLSSTKDTDAFLERVLSSASKEWSLAYTPEMIRRSLYISEVNVRLEGSLSKLSPQLVQFTSKISSAVSEDLKSPFEFSGISFGTDPFMQFPQTSGFAVERKIGAPFSENRYYSKAPLQTERHLELLADLEKFMT